MAARGAQGAARAPESLGGRLRVVGPGLIIAATGVGAGDLVSSIVAGQRYGTALAWAIVIGVVLKYALTEGIGRWYIGSGTTILEGWYSLGRLVRGYFLVYLFLLAFVFGAAVTSACGLAMSAMVGLLPVWAWAVIHGVAGLLIVGIGRYGIFETVMKVFAGLVFVTVVALAALLTPDLGEVAEGFVPTLPDGSLLFALGLMGGIGATLTLASYTYWIREKGWRDASWIPMMRLDCKVGYAVTGIFALAMLIVGAAFLFGSGTSIEDEEGLLALSEPLGERFGDVARWLFLIGFWATAFDSVIGAWNGFAYLFADYVRIARGGGEQRGGELSERSPAFRGFLLWITFPPMLLLFIGQPVLVVIVYAALGAVFLPFLAVTLLWLLNSDRVAGEHRNGLFSNAVMGGAVVLFALLAVQEIAGAL
jgi:Mn2+/Fe2+ NRAMP family transporter